MDCLRRIFPWLCAAIVLLSGTVGRGVVLCLGATGEARLESVDLAGKCKVDSQLHQHSEGSQEINARSNCGTCSDVTIASESLLLSSFAAESALVHPPIIFDAAIALRAVALELVRNISVPPTQDLVSLFSDTNAIRESISLLI